MSEPKFSLHPERSKAYCRPFESNADKWIAESVKAGGEPWMAAADFAMTCLEEVERAVANLGTEAAYRIQHKVFNPGMGAFFKFFIREAMEDTIPFSLHHVVLHPKFNKFLAWFQSFAADARNDAHLQTTLIHHYHTTCFELAGRKLFQVSVGLADQLLHTELHGLNCDDLKLPYESIYIECPPELGFKVWNADTNWHDVEGIYLNADPSVPYNGAYVPVAEGNAVPGWRVMIVGRSKNPKDENDDALFFYTVPLPPGRDLETVLSSIHDEVRKGENHGVLPMLEEEQKIFRWVMNTMLYATMEGAEREEWIPDKGARQLKERMERLPKSKKKDKLAERFKQMRTRVVILLGRNVPYEREAPHSEGKKLSVMTRVRGHYRHYHMGVGRALRVRKWIQPFWRGPDDAPITSTTHLLKEAKESK